MNEKHEVSKEILRSADKHPNSRVSKLIRHLKADPTQKDIVLLFIEIAEHAEYVIDFGIPLKYYLDMFEHITSSAGILLNETGLLLLNSSKIYSRRVDYVHELIEHQILSLSNTDNEVTNASDNQESNAVSKTKGRRKRLAEMPKDPYEVEMTPKKIRKLTSEKRFLTTFAHQKQRSKQRAKLTRKIETENYIHPTAWTHASIVDLENEEEIDSKRNYKLFTYHVEHRYNTLIPDINFRLHFMVKDFIDEEEELLDSGEYASERATTWPPLSEEYVEQYLNLENKIFKHSATTQSKSGDTMSSEIDVSQNLDDSCVDQCETEVQAQEKSEKTAQENPQTCYDNNTTNILRSTATDPNDASTADLLDVSSGKENTSLGSWNLEPSANVTDNSLALNSSTTSANATIQHDSGLGSSILGSSNITADASIVTAECESELIISQSQLPNDDNDALPEDKTNCTETNNDNELLPFSEKNVTENLQAVENMPQDILSGDNEGKCKGINLSADKKPMHDEINLNEIRVHLPHLDDEGVFFSDLDEQEQRMLSPTVMAMDVFPKLPNKKNFTIIIDDEIRIMLDLSDDRPETYVMPLENRPKNHSLTLNVMKINEKALRRRKLFKLGAEYALFLQARTRKRSRPEDYLLRSCAPKQMKWFHSSDTNMTDNHRSAVNSSGNISPDFYGFSDDDASIMSELLGFSDGEANDCSNSDVDSLLGHRLSRDSGVDDVENQIKNLDNVCDCVKSGNNGRDKTDNESKCVDDGTKEPCTASETAVSLSNINFRSTKTKIQKWHEYLQPILAKSRERHHFNIFQLGTEIMNELDHHIRKPQAVTPAKACISFQDVMESKDPSYVSRYFLSSLLLANQSNIKITIEGQHSECPSEWKDIKFEVLSTKRHTVSIEDNVGLFKGVAKQGSSQTKTSSARWKSLSTKPQDLTPSQQTILSSSTRPEEEQQKVVKVNLDDVKPLKQIEKLPANGDDYDSGIFSSEEIT